MDDLTTERSFELQATWVFEGLVICFDMLPMGVIQKATGRRPVD